MAEPKSNDEQAEIESPSTLPIAEQTSDDAKNLPAHPDPYATMAPATGWDVKTQRYQILREHAKGGLGAVYLAYDQEVKRNVALKQILPAHSRNEEARSSFLLEAHVTGRLEHPGIVPIYGIGTDDLGQPYYAMRFIRGITLEDAIQDLHAMRKKSASGEYRLQLRKVLRHFVDTCNVIHYAHSQNFIHRDLKPRNIMLGSFGETSVVDWGLAKCVDSQAAPKPMTQAFEELSTADFESLGTKSRFGEAKGTVPYMSPEQAQGILDEVDCSTDIYGLGATLYHLLTGEYPGRSLPPKELFSTVCRGKLPSVIQVSPWVPKPLSAICEKAMAFEKKDRYATANELSNDVERWLADEPVSVHPDTIIERSARWLRQHRSWAIAGALSIITVAMVSSIAFWRVNLARKSEKQSREQTAQLYGMARHATDDLLMAVSEQLRDVPGAETVRRELLLKASKTYLGIIELRTEDRGLREEAGLAAIKLGEVQFDLQEYDAAIQSYTQARRILEELVNQTPDRQKTASWLSAIGKTYIQQSRLESRLDMIEASKTSAKLAIQTLASLVQEFPKRPGPLVDQADARIQQGVLEFDAGNLESAAETARLAATGAQNALEMVIDEDVSIRIAAQHALCRARTNYAQALQKVRTGVSPDATEQKAAHRSALAAAKELNRLDQDGRFVDDIATTIHNYGDFLLNDLKDPKLAIELFQQVVGMYEEAIEHFPDVLKYRVGLIVSYIGMGDSLLDDGEIAAALEKYDNAIAKGESLIERNAAIGSHLIETSEAYRRKARLLVDETPPPADAIVQASQRAVELIRKLNEPASTRLREVLQEYLFAKCTLQSTDGLAELTTEFLGLPKPSESQFSSVDHFQNAAFREAVTLAVVMESMPSQSDELTTKVANAAIERLKIYVDREMKKAKSDREKKERATDLESELSEQPELPVLKQVSPETWKQLFELR
ncbi:MAG: serine/threonine-protein kinase [Pirellulaceae bacterium]|nr:serine/threonine-protein kinase [Pirellulaceae bacterium]